jgi:hypothetical protein
MKFNMNEYVRVKVTPHGRKMLEKDGLSPTILQRIDAEGGYWEDQFWWVFDYVGPYIGIGKSLPIETEIEFPGYPR